MIKRGIVTTIENDKVIIDDLNSPRSMFIVLAESGIELWQYSGQHSKKPADKSQLMSINHYSKSLAIFRRHEFSKGELTNVYLYAYLDQSKSSSKARRRPISRSCIAGERVGEVLYYSRKGFIKSGKGIRNGIPFNFNYEYRRKAKFHDELLRVEYVFNPDTALPLSTHIWWCVPPVRRAEDLDRWIPFARVTQARYTQQNGVYETVWVYDHKCHPTLSTLLNGKEAETPDIILHDHLGVLAKPTTTSFMEEDPLLPFDSIHSGFFARLFGLHKKVIHVDYHSDSRLFQYLPLVHEVFSGKCGRIQCLLMALRRGGLTS
jgi:hypothetical protein